MKAKVFARRFIIVLITFALATFLFTIYATSINPVVRDTMSNLGIEEDVIGNFVDCEITAEAAYSYNVADAITNSTRSKTISGVNLDSYRTQVYDTKSYNSLAGTDKIGIEATTNHTGEDYMAMWVIYDLGEWAGTAVANGRAKVTVSGTAKRHKDMDSARASITATSSGYSSASSAYSGTDVGTSDTSVSQTFTNTNARYIRVAVCGKDKHAITGSMGKVEMWSIKVVFTATSNTAPSFPNTGHTINSKVSATDNNGGGITSFSVSGTARSNPYTLPDFGAYTLSATDWMKKTSSTNVYYYAPTVTLKNTNGTAYVSNTSTISTFTSTSIAKDKIGYNTQFTVRALPGDGYYLTSFVFKSGDTVLETVPASSLTYNSAYGWYHTFTVPNPNSKGYNPLYVEINYAEIPSAGDQSFLYDGISHPYVPATISDTGFITKVTKYASGTTAPTIAGTYTISLTTYTANGTNPLGTTTAKLIIHKIPIALSITASSTIKIYDGLDDATSFVGSRIISPVIGAVEGTGLSITEANKNIYQKAIDNDLSFTGGTAKFDSPNAGTRTITLTGYSLTGDRLASCYTYSTPNLTTTKTIEKASLTISIVCTDFIEEGVPGKIYDASAQIGINVILSGVVDADKDGKVVVSPGYTASFDTIYAGTSKAITSNNINLSGDSVNNYEVTNQTSNGNVGYIAGGIYGEIRARTLKAQFTTENKVYDGNNDAKVVSVSFQDGFAPCDADSTRVSLKYDGATFSTKNAGDGLVVTIKNLHIETSTDTT
ncbi:MAG: hypothetical protein IKM01_00970, partial [Clostridia bacterium]|nr:hypothetical protein [Clostridia bacterium]